MDLQTLSGLHSFQRRTRVKAKRLFLEFLDGITFVFINIGFLKPVPITAEKTIAYSVLFTFSRVLLRQA